MNGQNTLPEKVLLRRKSSITFEPANMTKSFSERSRKSETIDEQEEVLVENYDNDKCKRKKLTCKEKMVNFWTENSKFCWALILLACLFFGFMAFETFASKNNKARIFQGQRVKRNEHHATVAILSEFLDTQNFRPILHVQEGPD